MSARGVWAVLASTAVVCAACGSASRSSTSQSSTSKLALSAYLVRGHEETGLPPTGRATDYLTATQWTSNGVPNGAAEAKRLAQEGFREAMSVQTGSSKGQGVSWVMELGSASAAAREGSGATGIRLHGAGCDALHRRGPSRRRGLGPTGHRRQHPVHGGAVPDARR